MKILMLIAAIALSVGCTQFKSQVSTIDPTIGVTGTDNNGKGQTLAVREEMSKQYMTALDNSLKSPSDNSKHKHLWHTGKAYARILCTDVFRIMSLAAAKRKNARSQTNIFGGLISGGMGLAGVSSEAVGGASLLFSSLDSSFEAYDTAFLVSPDVASVDSLVRASQAKKSEDYDGKAFSTTGEVLVALNDYVHPCTFTGMQSLLARAATRGAQDIATDDKVDANLLSTQ